MEGRLEVVAMVEWGRLQTRAEDRTKLEPVKIREDVHFQDNLVVVAQKLLVFNPNDPGNKPKWGRKYHLIVDLVY
ncbi:hypothetical protein OIU85_024918 [Salix viminalis]|uniref:Uncharacterized protein n=1 Tax=Salix viminalis TaxID=40686 RepID=A0A9Q0U1Y6_SALVM|nr:hypothetical protein OIU85_024918 [Salix viminalis]